MDLSGCYILDGPRFRCMVDLRALHFVSPGGVPLATGMVRKSKGATKTDGTQLKNPADVAAFLLSHDDSVPTGTRDDALRMVAMLSWPISEPQLTRYLKKGVHDELQMGAINGYANFAESNRNLARDALLRTEARTQALLKALSDKKLPATLHQDKRIQALQQP